MEGLVVSFAANDARGMARNLIAAASALQHCAKPVVRAEGWNFGSDIAPSVETVDMTQPFVEIVEIIGGWLSSGASNL